MRILDVDTPLHHVADAPGVRAKKEDVAGQALHREVFVEGAHSLAFRLGHDGERRVLRDGATGRYRGEPRSSPTPDTTIDTVAVQHGAAAPM